MSIEIEEKQKKMALTPDNYKLMLVGLAVVFIGMLLMSGGAAEDPSQFNAEELFSFRRITLAPIVIIAGFVLEAYAILKKDPFGSKKSNNVKK